MLFILLCMFFVEGRGGEGGSAQNKEGETMKRGRRKRGRCRTPNFERNRECGAL